MDFKLSDTMPKYRLIYFDIRGRGEIPRLLFNAAGVKFEDKRLPIDLQGRSSEWDELKSDLSNRGVPMVALVNVVLPLAALVLIIFEV